MGVGIDQLYPFFTGQEQPSTADEITESSDADDHWHPRLDADGAHRWLRSVVLETCAAIR